MLYGGGDYLTLHNVAGIYARLSQLPGDTQQQDRQAAVRLLARDLDVWRRGGGKPPDAVQLILGDREFDVLQSLDEFQQLLR